MRLDEVLLWRHCLEYISTEGHSASTQDVSMHAGRLNVVTIAKRFAVHAGINCGPRSGYRGVRARHSIGRSLSMSLDRYNELLIICLKGPCSIPCVQLSSVVDRLSNDIYISNNDTHAIEMSYYSIDCSNGANSILGRIRTPVQGMPVCYAKPAHAASRCQ